MDPGWAIRGRLGARAARVTLGVRDGGGCAMDKTYTGGCLCGRVRFVAKGAPDRVGICHCLDCRKHHGALFYAAAIYPEAAVDITRDMSEYEVRAFCPHCCSSVFARCDG